MRDKDCIWTGTGYGQLRFFLCKLGDAQPEGEAAALALRGIRVVCVVIYVIDGDCRNCAHLHFLQRRDGEPGAHTLLGSGYRERIPRARSPTPSLRLGLRLRRRRGELRSRFLPRLVPPSERSLLRGMSHESDEA